MDEKVFAFGSFRLAPARRILLDYGAGPETIRRAVSRQLGGTQPELAAGTHLPFEVADASFARERVPPPPGTSTLALLIAAVVGASIFGVGLLIGWAIWG